MVPCETLGIWIDEFSKVVVILDINYILSVFSYEKLFSSFNLVDTFELAESVKKDILTIDNNVKQVLYKSENNEILVFLQKGQLIKVNTELKSIETTQLINDEVLCMEICPSLEFIAVATKSFNLLLLNNDLELVKSSDLDDGDLSSKDLDNSICKEASISWRGDNQV
jgi:hypothetical protein